MLAREDWDRPLSDEVERLQDELKRLEITHEADIRRLQRVECLGLVALLLWYMNSYSEMRAALNVACAFIASEASAKLKEDAGGIPAEDLKEVNSVCNEKAALGANTVQASR